MNAAQDTQLVVTWEHEQGDWMDYAGDPIEEYREKFASGAWEVFVAYVKDPETGATLASLGGIVLARDNSSKAYQVELEAELLQEATEERKKDRARRCLLDAAPDLLKALKRLVVDLPLRGNSVAVEYALNDACRAIARAEGRTQ